MLPDLHDDLDLISRSKFAYALSLCEKTSSGCLLWSGMTGKARPKSYAYGSFCLSNKKVLPAHVVSYLYHRGVYSKNLVIRHKCDVKRCVNINHLNLGTLSDNSKDVAKRNQNYNFSPVEKVKAVKYLIRYLEEKGFNNKFTVINTISNYLKLDNDFVQRIYSGISWYYIDTPDI